MAKKLLHSVRFAALEAIERIKRGGAYSNLLLNELIKKNQVAKKDTALLTELVYGTISRKLLLRYELDPFIKQAKKVEEWVETLLELSLFQMQFLDRVPDHAIINEAVEIAKFRGNPGTAKFVNGVLRNVQRKGVPSLDLITDPVERLATEISLPRFLTEKFIAELGMEETRTLGLSLLEPSQVSARVDLRFITRQEAIEQLEEEGITARESELSPYGIVADKGFLAGSALYQIGLLTIQDESSMLVAQAMEIQPDDQILDACAAPGGKTTHMATMLGDHGKITALDIHQHKLKLITENAERLRVDSKIVTEKLDARTADEHFGKARFDKILVDAPCSGLGLMRRKPDLKYQKKPSDFVNLPKIQLAILESCAETLKPGGRLVYSTCTVAPEENEQVIAEFLAHHPEFQKANLTLSAKAMQAVKDDMLRIYPQDFMTDGFFICGMEKIEVE